MRDVCGLSLLVDDYDTAIRFFCEKLALFRVDADTDFGNGNRFVDLSFIDSQFAFAIGTGTQHICGILKLRLAEIAFAMCFTEWRYDVLHLQLRHFARSKSVCPHLQNRSACRTPPALWTTKTLINNS